MSIDLFSPFYPPLRIQTSLLFPIYYFLFHSWPFNHIDVGINHLAISYLSIFHLVNFYLMAILVHAPRAGQDELEMINFFRNIMVTGALMGFAKYIASDESIIG